MSNTPKFDGCPRGKKSKNTQFVSGFPTNTRDQEASHATEETCHLTSTRENNRKLALLECLVRDKECEIKRISHEHQLNITQLTSQAEYYKLQYNSMMEELQEANRAIREDNLDLNSSYQQTMGEIQRLRTQMQLEKEEFGSREKKCQELLLRNQKDSSQSRRELSRLEERSLRLDKDLQEARVKNNALATEIEARSRVLASHEAQLQRLSGEKQSFEANFNDALKDIDIYKGYLSAIEKDFHSAFPGSSRPNSSSKSFRYEWLVTTMRDVLLQFIAEHHKLQTSSTLLQNEREALKNEQVSIHNSLMREISLLQLQNMSNENISNSKMLHILISSFRESLQSAEIGMLEKTQDSEFLSKEISNLQSYITSLKQDKDDLQLSNTRLEQGNKKYLERINSLQKELSNSKKLEVSHIATEKGNPFLTECDLSSFSGGSAFSPSRGRENNSVMEKAIQEISNLERDKLFLQTQVDNLSRKIKNNQFFQSTPARRINTHSSFT